MFIKIKSLFNNFFNNICPEGYEDENGFHYGKQKLR